MKINKALNSFEVFLGTACVGYYIICAAAAGPQVSLLFVWPVMGVVLAGKGIACLLMKEKRRRVLRIPLTLFDALFALGLLSALIFAGFALNSMRDTPPKGCDYLLVLGARVNGTEPSGMLQKRIDAAYGYLIENEKTVVIGTGGRGAGAEISEGACIARELEKRGVARERILVEDQSATTVENIKFALAKIPDSPQRVAVASNGFHVFRVKLILANFTDAEVFGLAAEGGGVLIPHYLLREFIVLAVDLLAGNYTIFV